MAGPGPPASPRCAAPPCGCTTPACSPCPTVAVPTEEHRHDPTADDWVLLVDDWQARHLSRTGDPATRQVVDAVRRALPAVGYVATKRGHPPRALAGRPGAGPVRGEDHGDGGHRVRGAPQPRRPAAHAGAVRPRAGERDPARRPARGARPGVRLGPRRPRGPARRPRNRRPGPAAGHRAHRRRVAADARRARGTPPLPTTPTCGSSRSPTRSPPWSGRGRAGTGCAWSPASSRTAARRVLVGTRGLLGEGWDARRVTGLVDLTAVTTTTAVVQTRGRALRTDPSWPEKVALTWSVVCVSDAHPKGGNDWDRLVRKHSGFYGVDERGDVVDGVAHLDPAFSRVRAARRSPTSTPSTRGWSCAARTARRSAPPGGWGSRTPTASPARCGSGPRRPEALGHLPRPGGGGPAS